MDVWTLLVILVRRWYVVVPVIALTAVVAFQAERSVQATYASEAAVILTVPASSVDEDGVPTQSNPYLSFPSSLGVSANAMVRVVGSADTRNRFAARGLLGTYELGVDRGSPVVGWRVEGQDVEQVVATSTALQEEVILQLDVLQTSAGAPPNQRIVGKLLGAPQAPTTTPGQSTRVVVIVAGLGVALSASLAVLADTLIRRRGAGGLDSVSARRHVDRSRRPEQPGAGGGRSGVADEQDELDERTPGALRDIPGGWSDDRASRAEQARVVGR